MRVLKRPRKPRPCRHFRIWRLARALYYPSLLFLIQVYRINLGIEEYALTRVVKLNRYTKACLALSEMEKNARERIRVLFRNTSLSTLQITFAFSFFSYLD